ncbi:MAG: hypothetical protein CME62_09835 [Halobacteriovoraceae bacterium]|nr:hypothetical protein [Halobacteriovoraceae bacterium]|tara:strand:+ start:9405 stop:11018 length:1614 start_codon:yes stop_codon:yes gene_type:complete
MINIAVDFGSYSLKIIQFKLDKKAITIKQIEELVLDIPEKLDNHLEALWTIQFNALVEYLHQQRQDYQLILNMNSEIISTRMITLPVKNKKKAALMLPFQIEEDLPYPLSECHFVDSMEAVGNEIESITGIIRKEHFNEFHHKFKEHNIQPNLLTYDAPLYRSYLKRLSPNFEDTICILEFGHEATRGFFFKDGQLVSNHHSYVAGRIITEEIAATYNISQDEATIYKHQNGYVLTEEQLKEVNDNQREFAVLMHNTLQPLLHEIRRWEIGFRVKNGNPVSKYYICGGTSNLNNFQTYLSSELESPVEFFNPFKTCNDKKVDSDQKIRNKFSYASLLAQGLNQKQTLVNFLKGEYAFLGNNILPLESIAFRAVRLAIVCLLLSLYFIIDSVIINSKIDQASRYAQTQVLKKTDRRGERIFAMPPREIRMVKVYPDRILSKLKKQENLIEEEVKLIQSSLDKNAMLPLNEIASKLAGKDVEILEYQSSLGEKFTLVLKGDSAANLETLANQLEQSSSYALSSRVNPDANTLTINGEVD